MVPAPTSSSAAVTRTSARGSTGGANVRFGGGGHRDPWATLVVGDLAFVGDEVFVNVCRPGAGSAGRCSSRCGRSSRRTTSGTRCSRASRTASRRSSLEDRSQVGLGAVIYAGSRVGREAIVASNSYVGGDVPARSFAIGVPAKVHGELQARARPTRAGASSRAASSTTSTSCSCPRPRGVGDRRNRPSRVRDRGDAGRVHTELPGRGRGAGGQAHPRRPRLTPPTDVAVLDLLGLRIHGQGGRRADTVREFCRRRGIRLEPGPWRYPGGLV